MERLEGAAPVKDRSPSRVSPWIVEKGEKFPADTSQGRISRSALGEAGPLSRELRNKKAKGSLGSRDICFHCLGAPEEAWGDGHCFVFGIFV